MNDDPAPAPLDFARQLQRPSSRHVSYAIYALPAMWIAGCFLAWATSVHPEEDVPITGVFGAAPACALAIAQWLARSTRGSGMSALAVGLNLFMAMFWGLMFSWLVGLHIQDREMPHDSLPALALLAASIVIAGVNWWCLRTRAAR